MKIKVNEGHAGVMTLKDGTQMNYGVIRVTRNLSKMIFYTGKGLREMFKPEMTEEEKAKATELKKLDEKTLRNWAIFLKWSLQIFSQRTKNFNH